jgi:hypothetical protein
MDFDDDVHAEPSRLCDDGGRLTIVKDAEDSQDGVRPMLPSFGDLPGVDDKVFGQDRAIVPGSSGPQVVERSSKIGLVGEDADGVSDGCVGTYCVHDPGIASKARWRSPLHFQDEACAGLSKRRP